MGSDKFFVENLVTTIDKYELIETLKEWRAEARENVEADVISELLALVRSGDLDG